MKKKLAEWIWKEYAKEPVIHNADLAAKKQTKEMICDLVELFMKSGEYQLNRERWSFFDDHSIKHDLAESFQRAVDRRINTKFTKYEENIKNKVNEYISSEEFIDKIINRINTKQLAK